MGTKCPECFATGGKDFAIKCPFCGAMMEVTDEQIDNTFNANPKKLTDFKITKKQEITPLDILQAMISEKEEITPNEGFNVCSFDSNGDLGEFHTILKWFSDYEQAETFAEQKRAEGYVIDILGKKDKQQAK